MAAIRAGGSLLFAALAIGVLFGCGDRSSTGARTERSTEIEVPPGWSVYHNSAWGYSVAVPPGWHAVAQPRTRDSGDPVVILALASFPLRDEDARYPIPRQGFAADEAFVTLQERGIEPGGWSDSAFPERPRQFHFEPNRGSVPAQAVRSHSGIEFRDHWFNFTDAGRHFHVQVAIGASVPHAEANRPYRLFDTLRFDPAVKPDWPSAG
jgi:hypothetical protein